MSSLRDCSMPGVKGVLNIDGLTGFIIIQDHYIGELEISKNSMQQKLILRFKIWENMG